MNPQILLSLLLKVELAVAPIFFFCFMTDTKLHYVTAYIFFYFYCVFICPLFICRKKIFINKLIHAKMQEGAKEKFKCVPLSMSHLDCIYIKTDLDEPIVG